MLPDDLTLEVELLKLGEGEGIEEVGDAGVDVFVLVEGSNSWVGEHLGDEHHVFRVERLQVKGILELCVHNLNGNLHCSVYHEVNHGLLDLADSYVVDFEFGVVNCSLRNVKVEEVVVYSGIDGSFEICGQLDGEFRGSSLVCAVDGNNKSGLNVLSNFNTSL